jgi:hypothetical protein
MIATESFLLVYGPSGVGKTSLLQAGVFGPLRDLGHFPVVVRPGAATGSIGDSVVDAVRREARDRGISIKESDSCLTMWELLATAEFLSPSGTVLRPAIVLDQFEELFLNVDEELRRAFIAELADVVRHRVPASLEGAYRNKVDTLPKESTVRERILRLLYGRTPLNVAIVVLIREDRLGELQRLQSSIPMIFGAMYRVLPLDEAGAREAIECPAATGKTEGQGFAYAPDALREMLAFLASRSADDGPSAGINPALLQILCSYVDERRRRKSDSALVEAADLGGMRGMKQAVQKHYRSALRALPALRLGWSARHWRPSVDNLIVFSRPRAAAARLVEIGMITRGGWRTSVVEDVVREEFGVSDRDIEALQDRRLCVADRRLGRTWYELAHDRLVDPALRERIRRTVAQKIIALVLLSIGISVIILLSSMTVVPWPALPSELALERDPIARAHLIDEARQSELSLALPGVKLKGVDLRTLARGGTMLEDIDFRGADLSAAHFERMPLKKIWFDDATLAAASFAGAKFTDASFIDADLRGVHASHATFTESDLSLATLSDADLSGASFIGCDLLEAHFDRAIGIESATFDGTAWWEGIGWSESSRRVLMKRWAPEKLALSASYKKKIAELERKRRWTFSRYTRAQISYELAFRLAIHGRDLIGGLAAAEDAVACMSDRRIEQWFDRWLHVGAEIRYQRADIFDMRGYLRLLRGDARAARDDFSRCLRDHPRSRACTYHDALAAAAQGDQLAASSQLARSRALGYEPSYELLDAVSHLVH